jgi:hypothetical protein
MFRRLLAVYFLVLAAPSPSMFNRANIRTACPEPSTQRFAWALAGSLIAIEKAAWTWVIKGVH